jgi:alkaline phosphatase
MLYEFEREREDPIREPSLTEMTETAIEMLKKNENGFFLMVEGAKIDMGHHDGKVLQRYLM